jgi:hypothetical protein
MTRVSKLYPEIGAGAETRNGRPVFATTPQVIADIENHFVGWRMRKCVQHFVEGVAVVYIGSSLASTAPQQPNAGETHVARVLWRTSPEARFIYLAIHYAALEGGSRAPELKAELKTVAGADVDKGCEWTLADGSLEVGGERDFSGTTVAAMKLATTGTRLNENAGGAVTEPRPLYVGTEAGNELQLVITGEEVTIQSVTAWEMWEAEL